eukprot:CAMPEP_0202023176 /NCGR_PEP_ID=MMETSP0905-20130828/51222_1 /ASSEMBLY_ACC=CAM_ASM_000554 /TAXON_ID=420261 /ORGANISM="Thalassiosira antarctica, Strain CCMP982" /LENGTH=131 /DNA_ID=CAMNT_0048585491 /DNA_START=432 /DNA_END=825 /DNA_ORIENTATION=+
MMLNNYLGNRGSSYYPHPPPSMAVEEYEPEFGMRTCHNRSRRSCRGSCPSWIWRAWKGFCEQDVDAETNSAPDAKEYVSAQQYWRLLRELNKSLLELWNNAEDGSKHREDIFIVTDIVDGHTPRRKNDNNW